MNSKHENPLYCQYMPLEQSHRDTNMGISQLNEEAKLEEITLENDL